MTRTYLHGYGTARRTLADLETRPTWNRLHPEFRRRLVALWDACIDAGYDAGLGTGWRSSDQQRTLFLSRHTEDPSGPIQCMGKRWRRNPGASPAACPGRSYHEETDPDGYAFAADLVPSGAAQRWMNANAQRFGLVHFANVNNEPWHFQPFELPNSRSAYDPSKHRLGRFPLPGDPPPDPNPGPVPTPEDDMPLALVKHPTSTTPNPQEAVYYLLPGCKVWIEDPVAYRWQESFWGGKGVTWPPIETFTASDMLLSGPIIGNRPPGVDQHGVPR